MVPISLPLTTERLILRDITGEDTFAYAKMMSHPRMLRKIVIDGEEENISMYMSFVDGIDAFMEMSIRSQRQTPRAVYSLAVVERNSDKTIGNVELSVNDFGDIELGYCIHPDYQQKNYAYEACAALCRYVFERGEQTVTATTRSDNKASTALLKKLGMKLIGYKPTQYQDGMPIREYWMVERIPFMVAHHSIQQKTAAEAAV